MTFDTCGGTRTMSRIAAGATAKMAAQRCSGILYEVCGFRSKPITESGASRSPIPVQADH